MRRKWVVAGWVTAAAVAVAAGVGAVALAQGGTLAPPTEPMAEESVLQALEDAQSSGTGSPEPDVSPTPEEPEAPPPSGELDEVPGDDAATGGQVLGGEGGTFLASCDAGRVTIEWWVPAQGWHVSNVDESAGQDAEIEFESSDDEIEYTVACVGGVPQLDGDDDDDDDD